MADLYGTSPAPASASASAPESEEISCFLHQLLQNNPASSSKFMHHHPPQPENSSPAELFFSGSGSSSLNYSDHGSYFAKECADRRCVSVENNDLGDLSCDSEKGADVADLPSGTVRPRNSSKRSRAAEVHNLSEKRRRSRINEKMKALQNLIPNSNKTDKASMLDEAIEYLKQLQLQVQMLTMRNGLSLHPMCLPGVLQPMHLPLTGMSFDEGGGLLNTNSATGGFSENNETSAQTTLTLPNRCTLSNQPIVLPSATNIISSDTPFGFDPLIQAHCEHLNLSTSSKDICREGAAQAPLDTNQIVNTTSSSAS